MTLLLLRLLPSSASSPQTPPPPPHPPVILRRTPRIRPCSQRGSTSSCGFHAAIACACAHRVAFTSPCPHPPGVPLSFPPKTPGPPGATPHQISVRFGTRVPDIRQFGADIWAGRSICGVRGRGKAQAHLRGYGIRFSDQICKPDTQHPTAGTP